MEAEGRWQSLRDTLGEVAKIATGIAQAGITIRFLNSRHDNDGTWDGLKDIATIKQKMDAISPLGDTQRRDG